MGRLREENRKYREVNRAAEFEAATRELREQVRRSYHLKRPKTLPHPNLPRAGLRDRMTGEHERCSLDLSIATHDLTACESW